MNATEIAEKIINQIRGEPAITNRLRSVLTDVVSEELARRDAENETQNGRIKALEKQVYDLGGIVGDY